MVKLKDSFIYKLISLAIYIVLFMMIRPIILNADFSEVNAQDSDELQEGKNEQLEYILSKQNVWLDEDDNFYYAVTDYDQDGNLEIARTINIGSGGYNSSQFFEYNNRTLKELSLSSEYADSEPNPSVNKADCFYDSNTGIYYYYFIDAARNGSSQSMKTYYLFSFGDDNKLSLQKVKSEFTEHDNASGTDTTIYYDADNNEIDDESFNTIEYTILPDSTKKTCKFKWFAGAELKENVDEKMYESWNGFKMEN